MRNFAHAFGKKVILYVKSDAVYTPEAIAGLVDEGLIVAVKYAVVRDDPAEDEFLSELCSLIDPKLIISGIGERPAGAGVGVVVGVGVGTGTGRGARGVVGVVVGVGVGTGMGRGVRPVGAGVGTSRSQGSAAVGVIVGAAVGARLTKGSNVGIGWIINGSRAAVGASVIGGWTTDDVA